MRPIRTVALTGAVLLGVVAAPAPTATAGPPAPARETITHSPRTSAATAQRASTYWTRERMLAARPAPTAVLSPGAVKAPTGPRGPAGRRDPVRPRAAALSIAPAVDPGAEAVAWPGPSTSFPASTSGKVFYVDSDGRDNKCSGTAVSTANGRVVFTAGHCVARFGQWYNAHPWVFVPGYNNGNAPFGQWAAFELATMTAWFLNDDRSQDIGVAVVYDNAAGLRLTDVVGAMGIEWNWPFNQFIHQFGYPSRYPFNGQRLMYCTGDTFDDGGFEALGCDMTGGASGGAWVDDLHGSNGWVDGVNSYMFWDANGRVYKWNSPYFGDNVGGLLDFVSDL